MYAHRSSSLAPSSQRSFEISFGQSLRPRHMRTMTDTKWITNTISTTTTAHTMITTSDSSWNPPSLAPRPSAPLPLRISCNEVSAAHIFLTSTRTSSLKPKDPFGQQPQKPLSRVCSRVTLIPLRRLQFLPNLPRRRTSRRPRPSPIAMRPHPPHSSLPVPNSRSSSLLLRPITESAVCRAEKPQRAIRRGGAHASRNPKTSTPACSVSAVAERWRIDASAILDRRSNYIATALRSARITKNSGRNLNASFAARRSRAGGTICVGIS